MKIEEKNQNFPWQKQMKGIDAYKDRSTKDTGRDTSFWREW